MCDVDDPNTSYDDGFDDEALPGTEKIEALIAAEGDGPRLDATVLRLVQECTLFVLAHRSPSDGVRILHCEVPMGSQSIDMVPVFTRYRFVDEAIWMNPPWIYLEVVQLPAVEVLAELQSREYLAINPWSGRHEFKLPPEARRRCAP